jgi:hypothetical protein
LVLTSFPSGSNLEQGARLVSVKRRASASGPISGNVFWFARIQRSRIRKVRKVGKVLNVMTGIPFPTFLTFLVLVPREKAAG